MNKVKKQVWVKEFNETLHGAKSMLVLGFTKVTVKELENIRKEALKQNIKVRVIVNNLAKIAVKGTAFEGIAGKLSHQNLVFISDDEVNCAALSKQLGDYNKRLQVVCLGLSGEVLNPEETQEVADIPGIDALRSKLLGLITLVMSQVPGVIQSVHSAIARVVDARLSQDNQ